MTNGCYEATVPPVRKNECSIEFNEYRGHKISYTGCKSLAQLSKDPDLGRGGPTYLLQVGNFGGED